MRLKLFVKLFSDYALPKRAALYCATPHRKQLSAYLDNELDVRARCVVGAHLAACAACRHTIAQLETASRFARQIEIPTCDATRLEVNIRRAVVVVARSANPVAGNEIDNNGVATAFDKTILSGFMPHKKLSAKPSTLLPTVYASSITRPLRRFAVARLSVPAPVAVACGVVFFALALVSFTTRSAAPRVIVQTRIVEVPTADVPNDLQANGNETSNQQSPLIVRPQVITRTIYISQPKQTSRRRSAPLNNKNAINENPIDKDLQLARQPKTTDLPDLLNRFALEDFKPVADSKLRLIENRQN